MQDWLDHLVSSWSSTPPGAAWSAARARPPAAPSSSLVARICTTSTQVSAPTRSCHSAQLRNAAINSSSTCQQADIHQQIRHIMSLVLAYDCMQAETRRGMMQLRGAL